MKKQIYLSFSFPSRVNKCLVRGLSSVIGVTNNALAFILGSSKRAAAAPIESASISPEAWFEKLESASVEIE
ncbi:MAG: hypothetical protein IK000_00060 [Bacteroidaceae bacterium]|nr:hypothetical protein [Bacteroidaceae bacterium]